MANFKQRLENAFSQYESFIPVKKSKEKVYLADKAIEILQEVLEKYGLQITKIK